MSDEPVIVTTNAPLSELRVASRLRVYERIKLGLLVVVFLSNTVIGGYLIDVAHNNEKSLTNSTESLTILRCAVDPTVRVDKDGKRRTDEEARKAFDRCIAAATKE